jgi:hypothetical protein
MHTLESDQIEKEGRNVKNNPTNTVNRGRQS